MKPLGPAPPQRPPGFEIANKVLTDSLPAEEIKIKDQQLKTI
jgi:hypothetical protein